MNLTRVTFTGADDSVDPWDLVKLSQKYPFIEWGILMSTTSAGSPRFPSTEWQDELANVARKYPLNLSAHICGKLLRSIFAYTTKKLMVGILLFLQVLIIILMSRSFGLLLIQ